MEMRKGASSVIGGVFLLSHPRTVSPTISAQSLGGIIHTGTRSDQASLKVMGENIALPFPFL